MKLKLATYNIRIGKQQGLDAIADVLRDSDADIIALQEIGKDWIMGPPDDTTEIIAKLIGYEFSYFIPAIHQDGGQYGTAVISKIDLGEPEVFSLFQEVDEPRKLARFEFPFGELKVNLFTTHLSWIEDRSEQIKELCNIIADTSGVVFLMGDLNEEADVLEEAGLFKLLQNAEISGRFTFPADEPRTRIDYICASHGAFNWVHIHPNNEASDHLMVYGQWQYLPSLER